MSRFYIGQKIVAIKDHSQGIFKKDDEFTVLSLDDWCCGNINIGLFANKNSTHRQCVCGKRIKKQDDIWWVNEKTFVPVELSTITFEDVIKQLIKEATELWKN